MCSHLCAFVYMCQIMKAMLCQCNASSVYMIHDVAWMLERGGDWPMMVQ